MSKCHLSKWPAWPSKGRSEGDALTLEFLAKYSAAVMVDMLHSLSLEKNSKEGTRNVIRTAPKVNQMVTLRANVQNMVMGRHPELELLHCAEFVLKADKKCLKS